MPDDNTAMTFGARVRYFRERAGMTRVVFGELCGRSMDWAKAIENGDILMPRLPMLTHMARILRIDDLAELTGEQRLTTATYSKNAHEQAPVVARALSSYPLLMPDREPVSADALAAQVAQGWMVWHGSPNQRTAVATLLPRLLENARTSVRLLEGTERRSALTSLAQVYHLAQLYLSFQPYPDLILLTGDRAMQAAQDADNPQAIAAASWYLNHVWRDAGDQAEARIELAHQSGQLLRPNDSDEDRSLWGLLQLAVALSHAKIGRKGDAERYWDEAGRAAQSVEGHHPWLMFGPAMVDAYAVTMSADLTNGHEATRQGDRINLAAIPSKTRQAFHTAEIARGFHLKREPLAAVHMLNKAYDISPDTIAYNLFTRQAVQELMSSGGATVRDDARELAGKLKLTPAA
ncbi:helix-turn-helix domain-containing protein [Streptosporangium subroseum]|uniref:helix-turn-helix domain-containing protein n=1 Tax=Streptosporangium subroseum TaxID=106412 RepID=UPI003089B494|nr:helix-turn-helix domain-containing protein [Streptosporangium subroseum]